MKKQFKSDESLQSKILFEVQEERRYQDIKWGVQQHPIGKWINFMGEEFGEVCKAANQEEYDQYRVELIHLAATAIAAAECFDEWKLPVQEEQ